MDETQRQKFLRILEARTSVNSETGCWEYAGVNGAGYGQVTIDGVFYYTHQLSAMIFLNYDPTYSQTLHVLHMLDCPSRACWNHAHLYIGTNEQNIRDMVAAGTGRNRYSDVTHCVNGHEFTEENTYYYTKPDGKTRRSCRTCLAIRDRKHKEKMRIAKSNLKLA